MSIFSGTSYLGLDQHTQMVKWVHKGLHIYGTHYGGSRRSKLAPEIYQTVEIKMAQWTGAPAALLVSSGTTAGQLVAKYLATQKRVLSYSPNIHPALWGMKGEWHQNWEKWLDFLEKPLIVGLTDAVNPLKVCQPNWDALPKNNTACLVVDDSHYIGIGGENGSGHWRDLRSKWSGELIITASLGKSLATPAGLILSSKKVIKEIQMLAQFGGASPPPPAYIYALSQADGLMIKQLNQLQKNINTIQKVTNNRSGFTTLAKYPVIGVANHDLALKLETEGIHISSFRYPSAEDPMYTRIVIRADHTEKELDQLISLI